MWSSGAWGEFAWSQLTSTDPITSAAASRLSAFNFCNPFDHILPFADGTIGSTDRAHLWGLYSGIAVDALGTTVIVTGVKGAGKVGTVKVSAWSDVIDPTIETWTEITDPTTETWTEVPDSGNDPGWTEISC